MKLLIILPAVVALMTLASSGCTSFKQQDQVPPGQHPQFFKKEIRKTVTADYLLYLPDEYATTKTSWPLILFLHGAGERGNDLSKVEMHGPPKLIAKEEQAFPFVIVSPQCPEDSWWTGELQIDTLNALLDEMVSRYRIDEERIYVTGLSMGGYGTWHLAACYPDRFAAIAPICGGGNLDDAPDIAHIPTWVFHGAKDEAVPIAESEKMVSALREAGSDVQFTIYSDAGHDSWSVTYNNPELYKWFLEHTLTGNRKNAQEADPNNEIKDAS